MFRCREAKLMSKVVIFHLSASRDILEPRFAKYITS